MQLEHHDLHHEFPEHNDRIHHLKVTDAHFGKLFTEYDLLDHKVRNLEEGGLLLSDAEMEGFKLDRVRLKDELYAYLIKPVEGMKTLRELEPDYPNPNPSIPEALEPLSAILLQTKVGFPPAKG